MTRRDDGNRRKNGAIVLPKLCGADIEVANFMVGTAQPAGTAREASRALLREIAGVSFRPSSASRTGGESGCWGRAAGYSYDTTAAYENVGGGAAPAASRASRPETDSANPQDVGRKYLASNGGCVYIDLDHLELCLPEVLGAREHVAAWHAMLRIARSAQESANAALPPGERIQVLVNSSDGMGHSYGAHVDVLVSRTAYEEIFDRKMQYLLWLASYMVSSIIFTGQGKVGSENGAPDAEFQISQRADFFECLVGPQTTYHRPIVNSRDEALVGGWPWSAGGVPPLDRLLARMHVIFYDSTLAYVSSLLKIGVLQIVLAMIEAKAEPDTGLILEDPLDALGAWSRDPALRKTARLLSGKSLTAVELQLRFHEAAARFVESGACGGAVPNAREILGLWGSTLEMLERGDLVALASRVDWALKLSIIRNALDAHPNLGWGSAETKLLDHLYSSLDPDEGLFWAYDRENLLEKPVSSSEIQKLIHEPPDTTRAYTRAMLLRRAGPGAVDTMDWDSIELWVPNQRGRETRRTVRLWNPLGFTRSATESLLEEAGSLEEIVDVLGGNPLG